MEPTFQITGIENMRDTLERLRKSTGQDKLNEAAYKQAEVIRDRIESYAPVGETGNLKRSPVAKKLDKVAIAAIDRKIAPHAHLVEFGTSHSPAHPFFRPAIDATAEKVKEGLKDDIKGMIKGAI